MSKWSFVAAPDHWDDEDWKLAEAVVKNCVRLLEDAELLRGYGRNGSAFTLAAVAFEEVGKVALKAWPSASELRQHDRKWSYHTRKQVAAGCLLMADVAVRHFAAIGLTFNDTRPERGTAEYTQLREGLAKALASSSEAKSLDYINLSALENTKQASAYVDDWTLAHGINPDEFGADDCRNVIDEARTALRHLKSPTHLRVARALYPLQKPLQVRMADVSKPR